MRFYNIYRICHEVYDIINDLEFKAIRERNTDFFSLKKWNEYSKALNALRELQVFREETTYILDVIPAYEREKEAPEFSSDIRNKIFKMNSILSHRIKAIIDLYESMGLENHEVGIDVKIPDTDSLKDYIKCLNDIEFVLFQCPYLRDKDETIKFASVDVGSNWISLLVTGVVATTGISVILSNLAVILNTAMELKAKWKTLKYYENIIDEKEDLFEKNKEVMTFLREKEMQIILNSLQDSIGEVNDPEEETKVEKTIERLAGLLDRGVEFYASIDTPKEVQELFPKMEDKPLLEDFLKLIEDKSIK